MIDTESPLPLADLISLYWLAARRAQRLACRPCDPTPAPAWAALSERPTVRKIDVPPTKE